MLLLLLLRIVTVTGQLSLEGDPDKNKFTGGFIRSRGFMDQFHSIFTNDGYYIGLHRIIHPYRKATRLPLLFLHPGGGSGVEWLRAAQGGNVDEPLDFVGPNIGFEVAKRGYDVWLLENRGQEAYSINHTIYTSSDLAYWDYSLDELALFDLPAAIDYVRKITKRQKIGLIGIQYSATMYFFLASKVPRFNHIAQPFIALAPGFSQVNSDNDKAYARMTMQLFILRRGQTIPQWLFPTLSRILCHGIAEALLCNPLIFLGSKTQFPGGNLGSLNYRRLTVYFSTGPTGESNWQYAQQASFSLSDKVRMLNVSEVVNLQRYGLLTPPEYHPKHITNQEMHFISAPSDWQFDQKDLNNFKRRLGVKVKSEYLIPINFTAMSYLDGEPQDVINYVNIPILRILNQYN